MFHSFFKVEVLILLFAFFQFYSVVSRNSKIPNLESLLCCWCWLLLIGQVVWPRLSDLFVSQNSREFFASHSPGLILDCAYSICSWGQTSISCTIPSESPCPSSRIYSYTLFVLFCCIRLLFDWSFRLYHHIILICYSWFDMIGPYGVVLSCYWKIFIIIIIIIIIIEAVLNSSSSYRAASADIPDPLSPFLPIIHRLRQVFRVTSCVLT